MVVPGLHEILIYQIYLMVMLELECQFHMPIESLDFN